MSPANILRELKKFPNKLLGQNFLVDNAAIVDILDAAELGGDDVVVEIGPGLGSLTWPLTQVVKRVIAIEADHEFAHYLRLKKARKLTVVAGDALKIDWTIDLEGAYKIVANIPYSITSPLLRKIFLLEKKPELVVLLVQKELAERITAQEGKSDRGFLTILTEASAKATIVRKVPAGSFYPRPRVTSSVIKLEPYEESKMDLIFWPAVEAGFRHKRQTLANALNKDLKTPKLKVASFLEGQGLSPLARAQELSFEHWQALTKKIGK
ncbi:MAG: ribosomal RNA small subunit methyltransferase A [Candidatus Berkelbacteria bacterium]|nr:MAG: ribosomal RNA small subunit methyltransferase A [Candidatus Berkelbacteria bacterium]QQG51571.1 MAG: ribosomal RNA small subunit methyltransferase A [Candidatus Berkelbacteria bacterium]